MATIGYARVSTDDQRLDLQVAALEKAGCEKIFEDLGISAVAPRRPGFDQAIQSLKPGDTIIVWKMDRAFRSLKDALDTLEDFDRRGISFACITEKIETTTAIGRCFFQIRHSFAELERNMIRERTIAGMQAARERGIHIGRPRKLIGSQLDEIRHLLKITPQFSTAGLASKYSVSERTIRRVVKDLQK